MYSFKWAATHQITDVWFNKKQKCATVAKKHKNAEDKNRKKLFELSDTKLETSLSFACAHLCWLPLSLSLSVFLTLKHSMFVLLLTLWLTDAMLMLALFLFFPLSKTQTLTHRHNIVLLIFHLFHTFTFSDAKHTCTTHHLTHTQCIVTQSHCLYLIVSNFTPRAATHNPFPQFRLIFATSDFSLSSQSAKDLGQV